MADDEETLRRGREALREYRETEAAFAKCRATLVEAMLKAPVGGDEVHRLHASVQALDMVRKALMMMAQHGVVAEVALEQAAERAAKG